MQLSLLSNYTIIEGRFRLLFSLSRSTFGCPLLAVPMPPRGEEKKRRGARKRGKKGKKKERNSRFSRLTFRLRGFRLSGFYATGGIGLVVHLDRSERRQRQCFSSRERRKAVNNRFSYATIYARSRNELRRCYFRSKERGEGGAPRHLVDK